MGHRLDVLFRNMILGSRFFVNPSDSLAVIVSHSQKSVPQCIYYKEAL